MKLDRNQIIGVLLLFGIFYLWTALNTASPEEIEERARIQDSIARVEQGRHADSAIINPLLGGDTTAGQAEETDSMRLQQRRQQYGVFAGAVDQEEEEFVLENALVRFTFSNKGGVVKDALIKEYQKIQLDSARKEYKVPLHLMHDEKNIFEYVLPVAGNAAPIRTSDLYFSGTRSGQTVTFTVTSETGIRFIQTYSLAEDDYTLDYDITIEGADQISGDEGVLLRWVNYLDRLERNTQYERNYSTAYYREVDDDIDHCNCTRDDTDDLRSKNLKWVSHSNQFFNSSLIADTRFGGGVFSTEMLDEDSEDLKVLKTELQIPFQGRSTEEFGMTFYIGPNEFERLYAFDTELEYIIPFGMSIFGTINRWVIRPMFNILSNFISVKGLVILMLTLLVKVVLYPLTYKMLYSQAKMSALKPQLAGLKDKHKDDMQKQQMETMKVYREYGVSPLGGCLPMVAQMPIWFALYRFFPASIKFRQAEFLWASDLSSYDVFLYLPFEIPFYGGHVSLFTILWAVTTLMYTYYNTRHMDMGSMNPMMKYMQYFMPVMFLFFFNNYASGLTLYLFYSNVINIGLTIGTKKWVFDDEKIQAELQANRSKPKKKGGFQSRLEKAMKEQQRIQSERQKPKSGKKK